MTLAFKQRRDHHAIGDFRAEIGFFRSVGASTFAKVVLEMEAYARENKLPASLNQQVIAIELSPSQSVQSQPHSGWQRFSSDGQVEIAIVCHDSGLQYIKRDYSSWPQVRAELAIFFERMCTIYMAEVPAVISFSLSYLNQFRTQNSLYNSGQELIREGTGWVVPNIARFEDAWHSHTGCFELLADNERRLINVNVDCTQQSLPNKDTLETYISVLIAIAQRYDILGKSPLVIPPNLIKEQILGNFDKAHEKEKQVLAEIFSDPYLQMMGAV